MLSSSVLVFSEREKVKKKALSCFVYTYEERNDALLTMHKRSTERGSSSPGESYFSSYGGLSHVD